MNSISSINRSSIPIALSNKLTTAWHTAKKVSSFVISFLADLGIAFCALGLFLFAACYKSNFDPSAKRVKKDKPPILLIHGNGSNEMQWVVGRRFLSKKEYGSVFTLNLDGLVTNKPSNGIDDYAKKVAKKAEEISKLTGRNDLILIGHSMGGLVASHFAENLASSSNILVNHVITISTPWKASPVLKKLTQLFPVLFKNQKRYQQMRNEGGFLDTLKEQALLSSQTQKRKYYSIYSRADILVPGNRGHFSTTVKQKKGYLLMGHLVPMASPPVWKQIQKWLHETHVTL